MSPSSSSSSDEGQHQMKMLALVVAGVVMIAIDRHSFAGRQRVQVAADSSSAPCGCDLGGGGGGEWRLSGGGVVSGLPARVPGYAHDALLEAGVIDDPSYRTNEVEQAWVARANWSFRTEIHVAAACLATKKLRLVFDGIDTVATVAVNGAVAAKSETAFVPVVIDDARSFLEPGPNLIEVSIESALGFARQKRAAYEARTRTTVPHASFYNAWDDAGGGRWGGRSASARNFIRKQQSDFGWDWGPAFVPAGITGGVRLEESACQLDALVVHQTHRGAAGVLLEVAVDVVFADADACHLAVEIDSPDGDLAARKDVDIILDAAAGRRPITVGKIVDPSLWWPRGYGRQPLYALSAELSRNGVTTSRVAKTLALRHVELKQEPVSNGTSFEFRVNGVDVFAKGAAVVASSSRDWDWLLGSAARANMNLVRVWGYQADAFFEAADRLGLLAWVDFAFAEAAYPSDDLESSVWREVSYQTKRLQSRAAIFCGNIQGEEMLARYAGSDRDRLLVEYDRLFVQTVRRALRDVDPRIPFVDSSPSNGALVDDRYSYVKRWGNPNSPHHGDVFVRDDVDCLGRRGGGPPRFVSEFGVQSFPSFESYLPVTAPSDRRIDSDFLAFRQRTENGNERVDAALKRRVLSSESIAAISFADYLWAMQLRQGLCYETAIQAWRAAKNPKARAAGIITRQLDDVWPGPSWSTLEFSGKWKLSHSILRRNFADALFFVRDGRVWCANDGLDPIDVFGITAELWSWRNSTSRIASATLDRTVRIKGQTLVCISGLGFDDRDRLLLSPDCDRRLPAEAPSFLPLESVFVRVAADDDDDQNRTGDDAFVFFTQLKDASLVPSPDLAISVAEIVEGKRATIVCRSDAVIAYLTLDLPGVVGFFSDNAFVLLPSRPRTLTFTAKTLLPFNSTDQLRAAIQFRSLNHLRPTTTTAGHNR
ncbi:hypothetical protein CTAYLR_003735 [Chrysophaeum taylorii]|uniref:beta-mannosidase n=1 Tax=Chrysophaeum taylorii TaxID=2483200 RepID=A0AAD7XR49_9STRA|nr:hypothetical protein CTAYLR_003735 [Chrysophaeum taylorii]